MAHCRVSPSLSATRSPYAGSAAALQVAEAGGGGGQEGPAQSVAGLARRNSGAVQPAQRFRAAEERVMAGQSLGRGFRRVAAEPGQRHLVAVDGLRFGPDHRRQGAARLDAAADGSPADCPAPDRLCCGMAHADGNVADGDGQVPDSCGEATSAAGAAVPVSAARAEACSSCAVPTAASSRAMPPSATAASARRWRPLSARAVTSAADGRRQGCGSSGTESARSSRQWLYWLHWRGVAEACRAGRLRALRGCLGGTLAGCQQGLRLGSQQRHSSLDGGIPGSAERTSRAGVPKPSLKRPVPRCQDGGRRPTAARFRSARRHGRAQRTTVPRVPVAGPA